MSGRSSSNKEIAEKLERLADLLEQHNENQSRIKIYRKAAATIRNTEESITTMLDTKGIEALEQLLHIGSKLAAAVREIIETGRLSLLEKFENKSSPEEILSKVPGVGDKMASRIHSKLDIESLEELERAAYDGRLENIPGMGEKRVEGIRNALAEMTSRSDSRHARRRQKDSNQAERPPVGLLLKIDKEYRTKAEEGKLRTIAPRRFNPEGKKWLPIMKTSQKGWSFSALFSNTPRAHELDKTRDWVVIYYSQNGEEQQNTVITAESGPLKGKRIIPGREDECRQYYAQKKKRQL